MTQPDVDNAFLRQYLSTRDCPCPACGYNLRGLTSPLCPECGQFLELTVRLTEPRQAALITGLVGLAAGAGFAGLLLVYATFNVLTSGRRGFHDPFILINAAGLFVHGLAIWLWLRNWRRLRLTPAWLRRPLVVVCFVLPVLLLAVFTAFIR